MSSITRYIFLLKIFSKIRSLAETRTTGRLSVISWAAKIFWANTTIPANHSWICVIGIWPYIMAMTALNHARDLVCCYLEWLRFFIGIWADTHFLNRTLVRSAAHNSNRANLLSEITCQWTTIFHGHDQQIDPATQMLPDGTLWYQEALRWCKRTKWRCSFPFC